MNRPTLSKKLLFAGAGLQGLGAMLDREHDQAITDNMAARLANAVQALGYFVEGLSDDAEELEGEQ